MEQSTRDIRQDAASATVETWGLELGLLDGGGARTVSDPVAPDGLDQPDQEAKRPSRTTAVRPPLPPVARRGRRHGQLRSLAICIALLGAGDRVPVE